MPETVSLERSDRSIVRILSVFFIIIAPVVLRAGGQQLNNPALHTLILEGIDLTLSQKYHDADSVFRRVAREFPDHPAGYLYQAAVIQSRAMDHELQIVTPVFDSLLHLGIQKAESLIREEPRSPWGRYFLGTAYGYDSYARVYRGDWLGGAMKGFSSVSQFKKAIALDSTLYDAYAGVGTFYYWRSRRTEYFNWLPFLGDDRGDAFKFLERTARHGLYNRYTAMSMLVTIYTDAGAYDKAEQTARLGLERYPDNRLFLWGVATALDKSQKYPEAAQAYERLLQSILEDQDNNHYNEIVCRLNLVKARLAVGDSTGVKEHLDSIRSYEGVTFPDHLRERAEDKFEQARALERDLNKGKGADR